MPGGANRYRKYLPDGEPNPRYRVRSGRKAKRDRGEFIAVDGEGYSTRTWTEPFRARIPPYGNWSKPYDPADEPHFTRCADKTDGHDFTAETTVVEQAYVMLATSAGGYLYDSAGLSTEACLGMLIGQTVANPQAIFVGYGFNYDAEMMLADLPRATLAALHKGESVAYNGYELRYQRRKLLWIRDTSWSRTRTARMPSLTIYDTLAFFNQPFVATVQEWLGDDYPDRDLLVKGKEARSRFAELDDEAFIRAYNDAENRALVAIMRKVHAAFVVGGVVPKAWYGPGAVAAETLRQRQVGDHLARTAINRAEGPRTGRRQNTVVELETVPRFVRDAALHAFSGGRIEALKVGNQESPLYKYDVCSAYPSAMPQLPSLQGGTWRLHQGHPALGDLVPYGLYRVSWDLPGGAPFYPFSWRRKGGSTFYPSSGANWVWGPEVLAAIEAGMCAQRDIDAWISFEPATDTKPLAWVAEQAARRLELKALPDGHPDKPAHYPLKIGLNSLYGKFAQQRGFRTDENGAVTRVPTYYQPEWSGFITSHCRATVFLAAMQHPHAACAFQTDAVISLEPLSLDEGKALGQWEAEHLDWFTQCQSGVYWYQKPGAEGPHVHQHHRGFGRAGRVSRPLTRGRVLAAYAHGDPVLWCEEERLVSLGQALAHSRSDAAFHAYWSRWRTAPRMLRLDLGAGKRERLLPAQLRRAAHQLVDTSPRDLRMFQQDRQNFSTPYQVLWKDWESMLAEHADEDEEYDGTKLSLVMRETQD